MPLPTGRSARTPATAVGSLAGALAAAFLGAGLVVVGRDTDVAVCGAVGVGVWPTSDSWAASRARKVGTDAVGCAWNAAAAAPNVAVTNATDPNAATERRDARAHAASTRRASAHGGKGGAGRFAL